MAGQRRWTFSPDCPGLFSWIKSERKDEMIRSRPGPSSWRAGSAGVAVSGSRPPSLCGRTDQGTSS